ncbi:MAG: PAS domain S-box protein [Vicinamibacterales bacterium]
MTTPRVPSEVAAADQAQAHAAYAPLAAAGMTLAVGVLGVALWPVVPHGPLLAWLASLLVPFYTRTALAAVCQRSPARWSGAAWIRAFRLTFLAHGLAWAGGALVIAGPLGVADRALLGFLVAGVTASALNTSAFDLVAGLTVLYVAVVPWSLRFVIEGGRVQTTIGVMLGLFVVYMTSNARQVHRRYLENVALRYAAATRAAALAGFQASFARLWQTGETTADALLRAVTLEVAAGLRLHRACLFRFDEAAGVARLEATNDDTGQTPAITVPLAGMPRYLAALADHGRLVWNGVAGTAAYDELASTPLAPLPAHARLDVPFGSASRLTGVLCCERPAGPWSQDEVSFALAAAATLQAGAEDARRREAERQLRELNQNLEAVVAARTSALAESESRLALTLDATNDGVWDFNLETGAVYFSPVWARLLGYAPDEVVPSVETFYAAVHPDDVPRVQHTLDRHLRGELPTKELEIRMRLKTGEYRWFLDQGKVVERGPDGRARRMLGTISDITARKQALEDLHESELRFRALFDKSPMIVTLVDTEHGRIAEVNEVGLQAFGYAREEAVGRSTVDLGTWVDPQAREHFRQRILEHGAVSGMEMEVRRKDGRTFWALASATLVTFHGRPFALSSMLDVTERRELEGRVRQAQKMEVVGHLAGGVAHDFNNVLTVITSTAELALPATREGDPAHEALQTIHEASTRAARLTGQLLAFSRQQILQPALVDLNDLVTSLAPMVRRVVGEAIVLDARTAEAPVTVMVDRGSLEQVVLNVALNARDAMPDGGRLTIAVRRATLDAGGDGTSLGAGTYAALSVVDTGTGMSDATRQRIFEPFFTTKDVGKGTGLGLAMAHGVVQQSGGDIAVASRVGAGSTFTIYLALADGTPARRRRPAAPSPGDTRRCWWSTTTPTSARWCAARSRSPATSTAGRERRGGAADDRVARRTGRSGADRRDDARHRRTRAGGPRRSMRPDARILFSSGYAENAIAHHGVLAEGVQFIAKPYSLQALTAKVRETLDA